MAFFAFFAVLAIWVMTAAGAALKPNTATKAEEGRSSLFLPSSPEQYLPLQDPADMAMNDSYLVIADGDVLYIFDRAQNRYERYSHTGGKAISKLQFTEDGRLYFSDRDARIYQYDFASGSAVLQSDVMCSTFVIDGDALYIAVETGNRTTVYSLPHTHGALTMESANALGGSITSTSSPRLFVFEGVVYCAINNYVHAYSYNPETEQYEYSLHLLARNTPVSELTSVCVFGGELYYTVNGSYGGDGIYRTRLDDGSERLIEGSGFSALRACGERLFCLESGAVRELSKGEDGSLSYTGYEISSSSASGNRLSGAKEAVRAQDLLVIADSGNERVVICHLREGTVSALSCGAEHVATDGNVIAASAEQTILLYTAEGGEPYYTHQASAAVTGLTVYNGVCYYTTQNSCGKAEEAAVEAERTEPLTALTSDLYGNLYTAQASGRVIKYTEADFLDRKAAGEALPFGPLPADFSSLRADYEGNIYYLSEGGLCKNGAWFSSLSDGGLVYRKDGGAAAISFALGFEDGRVYALFGDYLVCTPLSGVSSLENISTEGISDSIFTVPSYEELQYVQISPSAAGIEIDLSALSGSRYFKTVRYVHSAGGRGLRLGGSGKFALVALFEDHLYRPYLFLDSDCVAAEPNLTEHAPEVRYLSSEVGVYRYPCITDALLLSRLARSARITLLSEIGADENEGFSFGYAELPDGSRGYVPLGYLTESMPAPEDPEGYFLAYLKANSDGVAFRGNNGETITVTDRTQVRVYNLGDGRYLVRFDRDGVTYTGQVTSGMIESGNPNALRISVIIVLCVLAVGILAAYTILVPKKKRT